MYTAPALGLRSHVISTVDLESSCLPRATLVYASPNSASWGTQYKVIYMPVRVRRLSIVRKLGLANGSTASGNFDLGLYDVAGTRLVSTGSTAQSGTSTEQVIDVTDTTIRPGLYYLAVCLDTSAGGTVIRYAPTAPVAAAAGVLTETLGSVTLPDTATWAVDQTNTMCPLVFAFCGTTVT